MGQNQLAKSGGSADGGLTVWLTGLSGSGKTTICDAVYLALVSLGHRVEILDGDVMRKQLCCDLGFTREDRDENVRRITSIAEMLTRNGMLVLVAAISPYKEVRDEARQKIGSFIEVHVDAPLAVCEKRDPKGLYRMARNGRITGFTGIDDPYEAPLIPDVKCLTHEESLQVSSRKVVNAVIDYLSVR